MLLSLYPIDIADMRCTLHFQFVRFHPITGKPSRLQTQAFVNCFVEAFERIVEPERAITSAAYRQFLTAFADAYLLTKHGDWKLCGEEEEEEAGTDAQLPDTLAALANHSAQTRLTTYGRSNESTNSFSTADVYRQQASCHLFHDALGLSRRPDRPVLMQPLFTPAPHTAAMQLDTPPAAAKPPSDASIRQVALMGWTPPKPTNNMTEYAQALLKGVLKDDHASFKSQQQQEASNAILSPMPQDLIVNLKTGLGKTMIFTLAAQALLPDQALLVLVPVSALASFTSTRLAAAFGSHRIHLASDETSSVHPNTRVIVASFVSASSPMFVQRVKRAGLTVVRLILDEAHDLIDHLSFRPTVITEALRAIKATGQDVPLVLMSGTLPVPHLRSLQQLIGMDHPTLIASPCMRRDLRWICHKTSHADQEIESILKQEQEADDVQVGDKILVIVFSKADAERLAAHYKVPFFHADMEDSARREALEQWSSVLFATTLIGSGYDDSSIRHVICVDFAGGACSMMQIAGRMRERSPLVRMCMHMVVTPRWRLRESTHEAQQAGEQVLSSIVRSRECIVSLLGQYLDGDGAPCPDHNLCSRCSQCPSELSLSLSHFVRTDP